MHVLPQECVLHLSSTLLLKNIVFIKYITIVDIFKHKNTSFSLRSQPRSERFKSPSGDKCKGDLVCFVKNFRVGPLQVAHRSERFKFPKEKASICCNKNFRVGQFLCDICWLPTNRNLNRYERTTSPFV